MDLSGFDPATVAPAASFEPLPAGWYSAMIVDSKEKQTKNAAGSYLELTLEVIDGPAKGRKLWARLNLNNANGKAVEIAQRDLSSICHAVGLMHPKDSAELHNKPLAVRVTQKHDDYSGEMKNEIRGFRGLKDAAPAAAAAPVAEGKKAPPWQRKAG
jgi:hypothetical protein